MATLIAPKQRMELSKRQTLRLPPSTALMTYWLLFLVFFSCLGPAQATSSYTNPSPEGKSWAPCSFAVDKISAEGNGSTYGSCLGCDPTNFQCPPKCQSLIDALYTSCRDVYAPQDYYFNPAKTMNGLFNDNFDQLRIDAARCGCSGNYRLSISLAAVTLSIFTAMALFLA